MKKVKTAGVVIDEGEDQMELFRQCEGPVEQQSKKEDEDARTVLQETEGLEENNVRTKTPAECRVHAQRMTSDELSDYLVNSGLGEALAKLVQLKPYIREMWVRFEHLKRGESIVGCRTKEEYCTKILNRTPRAVQYLLYGRTPKRPAGAHSDKQPKSSTSKTIPDRPCNIVSTTDMAIDRSDDEAQASRPGQSAIGIRAGNETHGEATVLVEEAEIHEPKADIKQRSETPESNAVPDLPLGVLDGLSRQINEMADTLEIDEALTSFIEQLIHPLLERHPYSPSASVSIHASRSGRGIWNVRSRMAVGDWLESLAGVPWIMSVAGREHTLGRVVGIDKHNHPRVRWYDGAHWTKACRMSRYDSKAVRVLFASQAAK